MRRELVAVLLLVACGVPEPERLNVKDFGVVGDGTDETARIQLALDCAEASGRVAVFPEGEYTISDTLEVGGPGIEGASLVAPSDFTGPFIHLEGFGKDWKISNGISWVGVWFYDVESGSSTSASAEKEK